MEPKKILKDAEAQFAQRELKRYKDAIVADPRNKDAYVGLGKQAILLGLYDEAALIFNHAAKNNPTDPFFYIQLGDVYYNAGDDEKAIVALEMAHRIQPDLGAQREQLMDLYVRRGHYQKALRKFSEQDDLCRTIFEVALKNAEIRMEIVRTFCSLLEEKPYRENLYRYILELCIKDHASRDVARHTFRWIIAHHVDCAFAFKALYDLSLEDGVYEPAIEECYKTLKVMPTHEQAHYYLRLLFYRSQDYVRAVKTFQDLVTLAPKIRAFHVSLAKAHIALGQKAEAMKVLRNALNFCGDDDEIYALLVQMHMEEEDYEQALRLVEKSQHKVKEPRLLYQMQYQLYLHLQQPQKAVLFYQKAIHEYPSDKNKYEDIFEVCCEVGFYREAMGVVGNDVTLVKALLALAKMDMSFQHLAELYEEALDLLPQREELYRMAIDECVQQERLQEAVALAKQMLHRWPRRQDIAQEVYTLSLRVQDWASALAVHRCFCDHAEQAMFPDVYSCAVAAGDYLYAANYIPDRQDTYVDLYQLCRKEEKIYTAIHVAAQGHKLFPQDANLFHLLMTAYKEEQLYEEALSLCRQVAPDQRSVRYYLTSLELLLAAGQTAQALALAQEAANRYPKEEDVVYRLCEIVRQQDDLEEATAVCAQAVRQFPNSAAFVLWLGDLYERNNEFDRAAASYDKAISLQPAEKSIYQKLLTLYRKSGQTERMVFVCEKALEQFSQEFDFYMELGQIYRQMQQFSVAIDIYRRALKIAPGNRLCYMALFQVYSEMGDFTNALRICPEDRESFLALYELCVQKNDEKMAVETLKKSVRIFSTDLDLHQKLAASYFKLGQLVLMEGVLKKILELDGRNREAFLNLYRVRCQMNHFEDAAETLEQSLMIWPKDEDLWLHLAAVRYRLAQWDGVAECYERLLKINEYRKQVYLKLAMLYEKREMFAESSQVYREALQRFPYEIDFYKKRAHVLAEIEEYSEAVKVLRDGLKQNDQHIPLYEQLGHVYKVTGYYKECCQCFKDIIALDRDNEQRYVDLGEIYVHFEKEIEAIDLFKGIIAKWPHNVMAYRHLFNVYVQHKKFDYAEEFFAQLADKEKTSQEPYFLPHLYVFNLYYKQKKYIEAIDFLEQLLPRFPEELALILRLGSLYYKVGKVSEAIVYYQKALAVAPEIMLTYQNLFIIYFKANRWQEAMKIYKQALSYWPEAKQQFAMLYKICSKIELDEQVYQKIEAVLEDLHQVNGISI